MMSAFPIPRNRKRGRPFVLLALALCAVLACAAGGCKDDPAARRQVTKKVVPPTKPVPAPAKPEVAEPETPESLSLQSPEEGQPISVYRPKAIRDPFKSFVTTRTEVPDSREETPKYKTPLQRYSLDQLKVVGIIAGRRMRKALLEDDVGKGYVVSVGDAIGSEGGKITAIRDDRILIESTYRDGLGNKKVRRITKKLYISEEGDNP